MASASQTLTLRLSGAVAASAAFGLIAATVWPQSSLWLAIGLGFLFGTSFIGGTGYRIIIAVARGRKEPAPASWSGASAGAALFALLLWGAVRLMGWDGRPVLLGFGIGINIAYLLAKTACVSADCCHAVPKKRLPMDLRLAELTGTFLALAAAAGLAMVSTRLAAAVAVGGHLLVRLISRGMRGRWAWGWPPLRQPGAEIAPLVIVLAVSLAPL
jgi:hypothetical protein